MEKQFQVSTHMNVPQKSIQDEIKRKIGRRVLYCLLLLFFTLTGLTIFDATRAFNHLSKSMKTLGEQVSEFIISQAVIDNQQSIPLQLKSRVRIML